MKSALKRSYYSSALSIICHYDLKYLKITLKTVYFFNLMLNRCNYYDCTVCQRFSWILFTIHGVLTVRECNELDKNHSAKEKSLCACRIFIVKLCDSAGLALNFISANDITLQLKIKIKKNNTYLIIINYMTKKKINAKLTSFFSLIMNILSEPLLFIIKLSYLRDNSTRHIEAGNLKSPIKTWSAPL